MKPDWKDAPEWANFLAMDADGVWAWFEKKPVWNRVAHMWSCDCGKWENATEAAPLLLPTVEPRP